MTIHHLDETLERAAAGRAQAVPPGGPRPQQRPLRGPVNAREDPTGRPPLAIPHGCGCTWRPNTSAWPATWRRVKTALHCRVHGESGETS